MSGMNLNSRRSSLAVDMGQQQSLLTAINRFVQAVDTMDDTVMIPCRLRDMSVDNSTVETILEENNNNNKAVIPAVPANGDLYHFYSMLHAIRTEITAGPQSETEEELNNANSDSSDENDSARKTAASFRFHLRGLFNLLHQMTETAKYLSTRYEKDVSSAQTGVSSVSSFNM